MTEAQQTSIVEFVVTETHDGHRLDQALRMQAPQRSRTAIQRDIALGLVRLDGEAPKRGAKSVVRAGMRVRYTPSPPEVFDLSPENIPLDILFEDDFVVVLNKQAGLVTHPAKGHPKGTLANAVLYHLNRTSGPSRPGIVHRLDKDTTGVMVVAKTEKSHEHLVEQFQARTIKKKYVAVTRGVPNPKEQTLDTLYGRDPRHRKKFSSRVQEGKRALTHFRVEEVYPGAAYLSVRIETGRTHQIRVHLKDIGHPLVGDSTYGNTRKPRDPRIRALLTEFPRPALHSASLRFRHPEHGKSIQCVAPWPKDLLTLITQLRALE